MGIKSMLSHLTIIILLAYLSLAAYHLLALPVFLDTYPESALQQLAGKERFSAHLGKLGLSLKSATLGAFGLIVTCMVLKSFFAPDNQLGQQVQRNPSYVRAGAVFEALPINHEIEYETYFDSHDNKQKRDTGYRYATFSLSKGFQPPVYVSAYYPLNEHADFDVSVQQAIKFRRPVKLELDETLGVKPALQER